MREIEGKEEVLKQEYTDESMAAAGFTFLDILEMLGGFDVFMGRDEGDGRKGRGPCKNESYKVLNLTFYSVVSDNFKIKYKLSSAKNKLQEYQNSYSINFE